MRMCREVLFTHGMWIAIMNSYNGMKLYEMYLPQFGYKVFKTLDLKKIFYQCYSTKKEPIPGLLHIAQSLSKLAGQRIMLFIKVM